MGFRFIGGFIRLQKWDDCGLFPDVRYCAGADGKVKNLSKIFNPIYT